MLLPDQVRRLIYSRYLLARAGTLQGDGGELASAEALLAVHDSAEILMRVVTDHLGARPAHDFMDFWKNVKDSGHPEPPYRGAMDRVNNLRVGFKHKGNLPHPGVVRDLMPSVTAFCLHVHQFS
jgi:hypothetical protein